MDRQYSQTFAELKRRRYSGTVHRGVALLLASDGAVARRTQRVRKATKLGVPVVDAARYLDACAAADARPAAADFLLVAADAGGGAADAGADAVAGNAAADGAGAAAKVIAPDPDSDAFWAGSTSFSNGCSCSCHDAVPDPGSCEWCVHLHAS